MRTLHGALAFNRFPTFCAVVVGGSTLLETPFQRLLRSLPAIVRFDRSNHAFLSPKSVARFLSTLLGAWLGFGLLNAKPAHASFRSSPRTEQTDVAATEANTVKADLPPAFSNQSLIRHPPTPIVQANSPQAGRTIDLTLFAVHRALDIIVGSLWSRRRARRVARGQWSTLEASVSHFADAGVFALSAALVMWAWFYQPERLPRSYRSWIRDAAEVDYRLVIALQRARRGEWVYGTENGQGSLLEPMCREYHLPAHYGNPATCVPLPCEVVHMGTGKNCEWHAIRRFLRAFKFSMAMYLPLNILVRARSPSRTAATQALKDAARSSAFLASFISLFYYGICLGRTRLGPRLLEGWGVTAQDWDSGLDVGMGCALCGWSILLEKAGRRAEIAAFVAPRAMGTLVERRYDVKVRRSILQPRTIVR